jgi:hypothetical protein
MFGGALLCCLTAACIVEQERMPPMDSATRRHHVLFGILLFCLAIEALTLYPIFNVVVLAVPVGMFGITYCMNALVEGSA